MAWILDASPQPEGPKEIAKPFWSRELPIPADVITGELTERGEWIVANVQPNGAWSGAKACELLVRGEQNTVEKMINIPEINVELFDKPPYEPFQNLVLREKG